jgi:hypothetical protein
LGADYLLGNFLDGVNRLPEMIGIGFAVEQLNCGPLHVGGCHKRFGY